MFTKDTFPTHSKKVRQFDVTQLRNSNSQARLPQLPITQLYHKTILTPIKKQPIANVNNRLQKSNSSARLNTMTQIASNNFQPNNNFASNHYLTDQMNPLKIQFNSKSNIYMQYPSNKSQPLSPIGNNSTRHNRLPSLQHNTYPINRKPVQLETNVVEWLVDNQILKLHDIVAEFPLEHKNYLSIVSLTQDATKKCIYGDGLIPSFEKFGLEYSVTSTPENYSKIWVNLASQSLSIINHSMQNSIQNEDNTLYELLLSPRNSNNAMIYRQNINIIETIFTTLYQQYCHEKHETSKRFMTILKFRVKMKAITEKQQTKLARRKRIIKKIVTVGKRIGLLQKHMNRKQARYEAGMKKLKEYRRRFVLSKFNQKTRLAFHAHRVVNDAVQQIQAQNTLVKRRREMDVVRALEERELRNGDKTNLKQLLEVRYKQKQEKEEAIELERKRKQKLAEKLERERLKQARMEAASKRRASTGGKSNLLGSIKHDDLKVSRETKTYSNNKNTKKKSFNFHSIEKSNIGIQTDFTRQNIESLIETEKKLQVEIEMAQAKAIEAKKREHDDSIRKVVEECINDMIAYIEMDKLVLSSNHVDDANTIKSAKLTKEEEEEEEEKEQGASDLPTTIANIESKMVISQPNSVQVESEIEIESIISKQTEVASVIASELKTIDEHNESNKDDNENNIETVGVETANINNQLNQNNTISQEIPAHGIFDLITNTTCQIYKTDQDEHDEFIAARSFDLSLLKSGLTPIDANTVLITNDDIISNTKKNTIVNTLTQSYDHSYDLVTSMERNIIDDFLYRYSGQGHTAIEQQKQQNDESKDISTVHTERRHHSPNQIRESNSSNDASDSVRHGYKPKLLKKYVTSIIFCNRLKKIIREKTPDHKIKWDLLSVPTNNQAEQEKDQQEIEKLSQFKQNAANVANINNNKRHQTHLKRKKSKRKLRKGSKRSRNSYNKIKNNDKYDNNYGGFMQNAIQNSGMTRQILQVGGPLKKAPRLIEMRPSHVTHKPLSINVKKRKQHSGKVVEQKKFSLPKSTESPNKPKKQQRLSTKVDHRSRIRSSGGMITETAEMIVTNTHEYEVENDGNPKGVTAPILTQFGGKKSRPAVSKKKKRKRVKKTSKTSFQMKL